MAQGSRENLKVKQFKYSSDNLGYLIFSDKTAIAVDGGAVDDILGFLDQNHLQLKYVTNTHSHGDHTRGNRMLLKHSGAQLIDCETLAVKGLELDGESIEVYRTPGHTADSLILKIDNILLTGDTLFIAKVGRCFSGDLKSYFETVKLIMTFPDDCIIYPGHDYVLEYLEFVRELDPENEFLDKAVSAYNPDLVRSTMGFEKKINPYLRLNDEKIIRELKKRGLASDSEYERWTSLMSLM